MIPGSANPLLLTSADSGYAIERSLRFNSGDSSKISRTPSSASNRKTWTMSYWVKRAKLSTEQMVFSAASSSSDRVHFYYESTDNIAVYSPSFYYTTNVIARDPGAWQHLVFACDTTQSTDTDRFKIYVNSVLVTSFVNQSHPSQNLDTPVSNNILHQFSGRGYNSSSHADVYLAEINFVDGQALDPTSFGAFDDNGVWQAIDTAGLTFGTNGFRLKFADNSSNATLGYDAAGSNNWTVNNLTASVGAPTDAIAFDGDDKLTFSGPGSITGDCTIECFIKAASYAGSHKRIISADEASQSTQFTLIRSYNNRLYFIFGDSGDSVTNNFVAPSTNEWHHIAMTRSGTTVSYFMDGTRLGTSSHTGGTINITSTVLAWGYGSEYFTGEISNARIVDGQALYTGSTYTVPTADLTTTSQGATSSYVTHLLANTSTVTANGGTGSAGTAGGNPAAVTASPFGDPANIDSLVDTPTNGDNSYSDTGLGGSNHGQLCDAQSFSPAWWRDSK
jgi:hypothetical protein